MADVGVGYRLTTPAGTIGFTLGAPAVDLRYISGSQGRAQAPVRAPMDDVPFGDGGLWYNFWKGPRHMIFDGVFLIQSVFWGDPVIIIRNQMEEDMRVALESIASGIADTGSLEWKPQG